MRESPFECPECGAELPFADVNVGADVGLCRKCGRSGPFLRSAAVPTMSDEELARPPKGVSLRREFGDALTIVAKPKKGALAFLVPFMALWSGASIAGIYVAPLAKGEFQMAAGLLGLPFLLGTAALAGIIAYLIFGETRVTIAKGRVKVFTGVFGHGRTREAAFGKGTVVALRDSSLSVNNVPQQEIALTRGGEEFAFGAATIPGEAKKYVAAALKRAAGGG